MAWIANPSIRRFESYPGLQVFACLLKQDCDVYGDERLQSSKTLEMSYCINNRDPVM
jgi:hypothetical protein